MLQAVFEKHNSFLRPLKKKGCKEERVTTIGWYDIGKSHDPGIQQEPPANPTYAGHQPQLHEMQAAARSLGMALHLFEVREGSELERAFAGMAAAHVGAFIVQQDALFSARRRTIIDLAAQRRLPGMYPGSVYPDDGGLISYAAHVEDLCWRTATYVDKILKGAQPAELPVERPIKFELVINLKTAQALGITIPPVLLFQADKVIR
jgi:ABC-type uncharacterized transport system substrate-binding protein